MIKAEVTPKNGHVEVKHIKKYARPKIKGAVMLGAVTLGRKAIGNLTGEYDEFLSWDDIEIPQSIKAKFRSARYDDERWVDAQTDKPVTRASALVAFADCFYYLP